MRTISRTVTQTGRFEKDLKREKRGRLKAALATNLPFVVNELAWDRSLDQRYRDHALVNKKPATRDCHVAPDLVLLYRKPDDDTLELVRLGSHSELALG